MTEENDDIFHTITMSEEISQAEGYKEGVEVGSRQGELEGNRLGWEKGAAIGSEVGFYAGFAQSLLEEMKKGEDSKPRVISALEKMLTVSKEFPLTDPQNPDLQVQLEAVRTKFKQVCSLLGMKPEVPRVPEVRGVSF
ncbi:LTO1-like protein [Mya arenaria]|uniref:LTO1-like protein n=1 Tax=Mya arenaria TaxID=6604 RepID=A0ABY7EEX7_MYAAR|nr:protein LTO1 homolog [Mya arenaria]XP_052811596.1 protein LTO1 homolog [Mya arenaria]WAR07253.1 LTO1-like protein [Mya arenaria]